MIAEGKKAPAWKLASSDGKTVKLADFAGKTLVMYFYPKDDTPGCTIEANDFHAAKKKLDKLGATVVGVSRDSIESHCKFRDKHGLAVTLASDEDKAVLERYGVWTEKSMYGRKYMGVERTTILVGGDGRIARIWRKVKVSGHAEAVLEAVKALP